MALEESMIYGPETTIPVYFTHWNSELEVILNDLAQSFTGDEKTGSAMEAMINSISASGYQAVVASGQAIAKTDAKVATIHGKLTGSGAEEKIPTLAIVAHYDSSGVAPVTAASLKCTFYELSGDFYVPSIKFFLYKDIHCIAGIIFRSGEQCIGRDDAARACKNIFGTIRRE